MPESPQTAEPAAVPESGAAPAAVREQPLGLLIGRGMIGGVLMGLANLVPGVSGGTMLLASGVYPRFIDAIAEVTTFRFRLRSLAVLAAVVGSAAVAVLLLAGAVAGLVVNHRWIMYSLFIGLTLGGLPVVWRLIHERTRALWFGAAGGFAAMALLALLQARGAADGILGGSNFLTLGFAGAAGASAMILPGVSGGYLLLVLGQYLPILNGIRDFKDGLQAGDLAAAMGPALGVMLPVGIGVVLGVVVVSNLLRWLLKRWRTAMLGVLLGLLVGAVVGLYPFQRPRAPRAGEIIKGREVTVETLAQIEAEDWPLETFSPTFVQLFGSVFCIAAGLGVTLALGHFCPAEDE